MRCIIHTHIYIYIYIYIYIWLLKLTDWSSLSKYIHNRVQYCQVHGFTAELGYFYTVATGCFFSPQVKAISPKHNFDEGDP